MRQPEWLNWSVSPDDLIHLSNQKIKYVYGIKDIQVKNKTYEKTSMYVSKPFQIDGDITEISLITNEYNIRKNTASSGVNPWETAIEYYVSFNDYDWMPILPEGQYEIENELLVFKDGTESRLRFKANTDKEISVYKNGIKLKRHYWNIERTIDKPNGNSENTFHDDQGDAITITKNFDKYAIYTTSYTPLSSYNNYSPWDIKVLNKAKKKFIDKDGKEGELFPNGTDRNGAITLSKYPFLDVELLAKNNLIDKPELLYRPVSVMLESAKIGVLGSKTESYVDEISSKPNNTLLVKNRTDYVDLSNNETVILNQLDISPEKEDSTRMIYPYLDYLHTGNKLYFTETFNDIDVSNNIEINHGEGNVRVKYEYLEAQVRLKVILRNTSTSNYVTPRVDDYKLIFKVRK